MHKDCNPEVLDLLDNHLKGGMKKYEQMNSLLAQATSVFSDSEVVRPMRNAVVNYRIYLGHISYQIKQYRDEGRVLDDLEIVSEMRHAAEMAELSDR